MAGPVFKDGTWTNKGNLIEEYIQGSNVRVRIYDGALVAKDRNDPKVQAILARIAKINIRIAQEAFEAGREI